MQDRFSFRCWCVNKNQWETGKVYLDNEGRIYDDFHRVKEETHIINFCTGLKDKNGKLIYEGDIVKIIHTTPYGDKIEKVCIVEYSRCCFWAKTDDISVILYHEDNEYEVINNIYENKDLLEEEK